MWKSEILSKDAGQASKSYQPVNHHLDFKNFFANDSFKCSENKSFRQ